MATKQHLVDREGLKAGIETRVMEFLRDLADEGERSAVVIGAARIDLALERLLKKTMAHHPGGSDNLFDPDRPLGTFAAKIALTYRLGFIDPHMEKALQLIRRIRNEFAHATGKASLSESMHRSRVLELAKLGRNRAGKTYENLHKVFQTGLKNELLSAFITTIAIMLINLELVEGVTEYVAADIVADMEPKTD
jgi:hypothetical protein